MVDGLPSVTTYVYGVYDNASQQRRAFNDTDRRPCSRQSVCNSRAPKKTTASRMRRDNKCLRSDTWSRCCPGARVRLAAVPGFPPTQQLLRPPGTWKKSLTPHLRREWPQHMLPSGYQQFRRQSNRDRGGLSCDRHSTVSGTKWRVVHLSQRTGAKRKSSLLLVERTGA